MKAPWEEENGGGGGDPGNQSFRSMGGGEMSNLSEYTYNDIVRTNPFTVTFSQIPLKGDGKVPSDCWFTFSKIYCALP